MRKTLSLSCLLVLCYLSKAQTVRTPSAIRYIDIGTYSHHFTDAFSIISNQAALCNIQSAQAGIYTERRFMLDELEFISAALAIPMHHSGMGLTLNRFGSTSYSETQGGLAYGKKLSDKVDIGVQFDYNSVSIMGYGGASTVSVEIGSIWRLTDKLYGGVHFYNPSGSKYGKDVSQKIPPVFTTGFGYEGGEHLFISAEIAKEQDQPVNVNVGVHYAFLKQFYMRFGIATGANNSFAGFGLRWGNCRMDISVSYNPQLGYTPGLSLLFTFKQSTTDSKG